MFLKYLLGHGRARRSRPPGYSFQAPGLQKPLAHANRGLSISIPCPLTPAKVAIYKIVLNSMIFDFVWINF
jgi:hypothetical protein